MSNYQAVKADCDRLATRYDEARRDLDKLWRELYQMSDGPERRRKESKAGQLQQAARILAGRHERAKRALAQLEAEQ